MNTREIAEKENRLHDKHITTYIYFISYFKCLIMQVDICFLCVYTKIINYFRLFFATP